MKELYDFAKTQIGVTEVPGPESNSVILQYAKEAGFSWINDDETPWCSVFANYCALKAGFERSGKANARSWLTVGESIETPEIGCVVVFKRGTNPAQGHVGFYAGRNANGSILVLGGNQRDSVSIVPYRAENLLGFRKLRKIV